MLTCDCTPRSWDSTVSCGRDFRFMKLVNSWLWRLILVFEMFTLHNHAIYIAHPYLWKFTSVLYQCTSQSTRIQQSVWFLLITDCQCLQTNISDMVLKQGNLLIWLKLHWQWWWWCCCPHLDNYNMCFKWPGQLSSVHPSPSLTAMHWSPRLRTCLLQC